MTKIISMYAFQVLLGVVAMASGYAKLAGAGVMVEQFQMMGLGEGFLNFAGVAEISAGLCLLLPRGGIIGAVLLASVMVGAIGITIGHLASAASGGTGAPALTSTSFRAQSDAGMVRIVRPRSEWDI